MIDQTDYLAEARDIASGRVYAPAYFNKMAKVLVSMVDERQRAINLLLSRPSLSGDEVRDLERRIKEEAA